MDGDGIGKEFAGYRIERLLGRGGMSVVYLAEQRSLSRKVALKVMAPELAEDAAFRERFVRESLTAASLDHPNVIPIYEAGEHEGDLYIAMRYVEASDLKSLLAREGALELARVLSIMGQVAGALDAAHRRDLVHRDVKPANILIVPQSGPGTLDHAYLADFGLTKHAASHSGLTQTGHFVGTVDYAAPEQIHGKALDGRTDQYALACVLYECLTGDVPFHKDSSVAVIYAHVYEPPPVVTEKRPDLPPAIDGVLAKGMAKAKEDRYPTCGALVDAARASLESVLPKLPASTPGVTEVRPLRANRDPTRSRRALLFAGVVLAVVLASLAFVVLKPSENGSNGTAAGDVVPRITFKVNGKLFRVAPTEGAVPEDVSKALDAVTKVTGALPKDTDPKNIDEWLNVSPGGRWFLMSTLRSGCHEWACALIVSSDLKTVEVVESEGDLIHPDGVAAIASGGDMIVYRSDGENTKHGRDLWVTKRARLGWSEPKSLTTSASFINFESPAISADGKRVVFECMTKPDQYEGRSICEVGTDGSGFRVLVKPEDGPNGSDKNFMHQPDYEPSGSIVFEANWEDEGDQIWRLVRGTNALERVNPNHVQDGHPCALSDGRIVSLWYGRRGGPGKAEVKVMSPDGAEHFLFKLEAEDAGVGCA